MTIHIGADHKGFDLKTELIDYLRSRGYSVHDVSGNTRDPDDDFPVFASRVASAVLSDSSESRGILLCGSGQGMVMAANRHKGIRAGLGWSVDAAQSIRRDEDSNVLALPAELIADSGIWHDIVDTWLSTEFAGSARYRRRNRQLDEL